MKEDSKKLTEIDSIFKREKKKRWLESTNFRCLLLAGLTFILIIILLVKYSSDSLYSVLLINLLSIICTASVSYWLASVSNTKQLKSFAQSAMNHLNIVSSNIREISEKTEQEKSNLKGSTSEPNKEQIIGVLENISAMTHFLQSHIEFGAENWVGLLAEEFDPYKRERIRLYEELEREKQKYQEQIMQLDGEKEDGKKEIAKLREEIRRIQAIQTNSIRMSDWLSAIDVRNPFSKKYSDWIIGIPDKTKPDMLAFDMAHGKKNNTAILDKQTEEEKDSKK